MKRAKPKAQTFWAVVKDGRLSGALGFPVMCRYKFALYAAGGETIERVSVRVLPRKRVR